MKSNVVLKHSFIYLIVRECSRFNNEYNKMILFILYKNWLIN